MNRAGSRVLALVLWTTVGMAGSLESRQVPAAWGAGEAELAAPSGSGHGAIGLGRRFQVEPLALLSDAETGAPQALAALAAHNLAGRVPQQVGFERPLPHAHNVSLSAVLLAGLLPGAHAGGVVDLADGDRVVWAARIEVAGAYGLRVLLADAHLPEGSRVWAYGATGPVRGPVGPAHATERGIWTPTVFDQVVFVEVDLPRAALLTGERAELTLGSVAEIFRLDPAGRPLTGALLETRTHGGCLVDAMCKDENDLSFIEDYRKAVANLIFQKGVGSFTCTGGLLNTTEGPKGYLLTANHCFDTQASASSLDAFWDHNTPSCGGADPGILNMESTSGSTLLATSAQTDMTLVEITGPLPQERYHLGWSLDALPHGTTLHRLHHPGVTAQHYSRSTVDDSGRIVCGTIPRPRFLYSQLEEGGELGGSSGSVVVIDAAGGQVVGQLLGVCGTNIGNACDYVNNRTVDGALRESFVHLHQLLDPDGTRADDVAALSGFSLAAGESVHDFECGQVEPGRVFAFTFQGTVSGMTGSSSFASDLRLVLSGPSGSAFDVGGFDNLSNPWSFQGPGSTGDGTYASTHSWVFPSDGDGATTCSGTWQATFSNDWSLGVTMTWSDVTITLHKLAPPCPIDDHLVLTSQTVAGTETFQACRTITAGSGFTVAPTGDVTFRAGRRIVLGDGFTVEAGGRFAAEIDPSLVP